MMDAGRMDVLAGDTYIDVWRYGGTDIEATKHVTCLAYVHNTVHIHNIHEIYKYIYTLRTAIKRIKRCEQALKHPKPTETELEWWEQFFFCQNTVRFRGIMQAWIGRRCLLGF